MTEFLRLLLVTVTLVVAFFLDLIFVLDKFWPASDAVLGNLDFEALIVANLGCPLVWAAARDLP